MRGGGGGGRASDKHEHQFRDSIIFFIVGAKVPWRRKPDNWFVYHVTMTAECEATYSHFLDLARPVFVRIFSQGRTLKRGRKFAREGFLHNNILVDDSENDAVVRGYYWAIQTRYKKHRLLLAL